MTIYKVIQSQIFFFYSCQPCQAEGRGVFRAFSSLLFYFYFIFIQVLCPCATLWVMIDLPPASCINVWPEAPYFITVSTFSRRNLFVTFEIPLLRSPLFFVSSKSFNHFFSKPFWLKHNRMAAKKFMDITTTSTLFLLLLVVPTGARYLSGEAIETQPGITAMDGISPVPTEAPGFHGIPKELRKRATQNSDDYPPSNWCGFIDGNTREFWALIASFGILIILSFYLIWPS